MAAVTGSGRRVLFWQLVRYGVNGVIVTSLYTAVYVALDSFTHAPIQLCNLIGYLAAASLGYLLHSRITFRGYGARGRAAQARFFLASLPSYVLNALWTWGFLTLLRWPHWTVQVPIWCVTPVLMFAINRWWVFK